MLELKFLLEKSEMPIAINLHLSLDWHVVSPLTIINSSEGRSTAQGVIIKEIGASPISTQDWVWKE